MSKQKSETVVITITLKQDIINKIDTLAPKMELKPTRFAGNLIDVGLEEFRIAKKNGFLKFGTIAWNILKQYTNLFIKNKRKKEPRPVSVTIRIRKELNEEIDKYVSELQVTKNMFIEYCIEMALENLQFMQDIGIFNALVGIVRLEKEMKEIWDNKINEGWIKRFKEAKVISENMFDVVLKES